MIKYIKPYEHKIYILYMDITTSNKGISPVISLVLLVAITVALVSLITVIVWDISDDPNSVLVESATGVQVTENEVRYISNNNNGESFIIELENGTQYELSNIGESYSIPNHTESFTVFVSVSGDKMLVQSVSRTSTEDVSEVYESEPNCTTHTLEKEDGIIQVDNIHDLQCLNQLSESTVKLNENIDASVTKEWNNGKGFDPIDGFEGTVIGNNKEISNLYINRPYEQHVGLFGDSSGYITSLGLHSVTIIGNNEVGGLYGYNKNPEVEYTYVTGSVKATDGSAGGLIGFAQANGFIDYTYTAVELEGDNIGGIIAEQTGDAPITTKSYWDIEISQVTESEGGTGLRTEQMIGDSAEDNMDFNFDTTWKTIQNNYPKFR